MRSRVLILTAAVAALSNSSTLHAADLPPLAPEPDAPAVSPPLPLPAPPSSQPPPSDDHPSEGSVQSHARLREYALDYQYERPRWAFEISYSPKALGGTEVGPNSQVYARGVNISIDFQPAFLQKFGVIAFGPSGNIYPILPMQQYIANSIYSVWSVGGQFRYQARYFKEQLIVPVFGYDIEHFAYNLVEVGNGAFNANGYIAGVYILMNPLEPSAAFDLHREAGILRSYLTAEVRDLKGSDANLNVTGVSYFIGIRTEF